MFRRMDLHAVWYSGVKPLSPASHAVDGGVDRYYVLLQLPFGRSAVAGCGRNRAAVGEYVIGGDLCYGGFLRQVGRTSFCFLDVGMFHRFVLAEAVQRSYRFR